MLKISIPTPCHQDWNAMTANEQGRHCNACAKTVVAFTTMSDDAVKHFFLIKKKKEFAAGFAVSSYIASALSCHKVF